MTTSNDIVAHVLSWFRFAKQFENLDPKKRRLIASLGAGAIALESSEAP